VGKGQAARWLEFYDEFIATEERILSEMVEVAGNLPEDLRDSVEAFPVLKAKKTVDLFKKYGVLTKSEYDSRIHIAIEKYVKQLGIEAETMVTIAKSQILPAALALVVLYEGLMRLTGSTTVSILTVVALAVSHTFWTYAVVPKAYSLTLLILALCLLLLHQWRETSSRWRIVAVGILMGLGVMNHLIVITALPGMLVFVLWQSRHRIRDFVLTSSGFIVGLLPYVYLLSSAPDKSATTGGVQAAASHTPSGLASSVARSVSAASRPSTIRC